jgi:hypothetical protein
MKSLLHLYSGDPERYISSVPDLLQYKARLNWGVKDNVASHMFFHYIFMSWLPSSL